MLIGIWNLYNNKSKLFIVNRSRESYRVNNQEKNGRTDKVFYRVASLQKISSSFYQRKRGQWDVNLTT